MTLTGNESSRDSAFVYLDDVIKFAALVPSFGDGTRRSESALPALERLRRDWRHYQDVRDYRV